MDQKEKMFPESGNWYKGNLHSHTTSSDGRLTPKEAVAAYKKQGYSFLCFSEHDYYTDRRSEFDCEEFIILPGLEASAYLIDSSSLPGIAKEQIGSKAENDDSIAECKDSITDCGNPPSDGIDISSSMILDLFMQGYRPRILKTHHIHGILGTKPMQEAAKERLFREEEKYPSKAYIDHWNGQQVAQKLSDDLKSRGCFTTYNHPIWSRVDVEEIQNLTGIWAMECYNYNTVNECSEGKDTVFWDAMLRRNNRINGFASDDNHNGGIFPDSFGGYVMVKSDTLDHESIVTNLLEGNYYFSNGAVIHQWGIKDGKVYVQCEDAERINFICGGYVGASYTLMTKNDESMSYGEYQLRGNETYVRIEVVTKDHKTAWTNPIML